MQQIQRRISKSHFAALAAGLALLAGCASPSVRIADALGGYGMDAGQALCVGQRLQANLTLAQLQQLAGAAGAFSKGDTTPGRLSPSDLYRVAARIEDPKVAVEVARAAAGCGILGSFL